MPDRRKVLRPGHRHAPTQVPQGARQGAQHDLLAALDKREPVSLLDVQTALDFLGDSNLASASNFRHQHMGNSFCLTFFYLSDYSAFSSHCTLLPCTSLPQPVTRCGT